MPPAAFIPPAVATNTNRTNSGTKLATGGVRQSATINSFVAAGATVQFPIAGQTFYLRASNGPLNIRPSNGSSQGPFDSYTPGTGLQVDTSNLFTLVEVQNPGTQPIAFSLWVGFGNFVDHRLIVETNVIFPIAYPTYPAANVAALVLIPDLSGQPFTDLNGVKWLALQRVGIFISNVDPATSLVLQANPNPVVGTGVLVVPPLTTMQFGVSGNYSLKIGAGNVNAIVSEIYNSLAYTFS